MSKAEFASQRTDGRTDGRKEGRKAASAGDVSILCIVQARLEVGPGAYEKDVIYSLLKLHKNFHETINNINR